MTNTINPVIPASSSGRASQPARAGVFRSGLARSGALLPISTAAAPTTLAWLPVQPTTTTWTDTR